MIYIATLATELDKLDSNMGASICGELLQKLREDRGK